MSDTRKRQKTTKTKERKLKRRKKRGGPQRKNPGEAPFTRRGRNRHSRSQHTRAAAEAARPERGEKDAGGSCGCACVREFAGRRRLRAPPEWAAFIPSRPAQPSRTQPLYNPDRCALQPEAGSVGVRGTGRSDTIQVGVPVDHGEVWEMEGFSLEHQHGKARVRVARLWRGAGSGEHRLVEWNVSISITSHVLPAFTDGDNSKIVATDSIKNTVCCVTMFLCFLRRSLRGC